MSPLRWKEGAARSLNAKADEREATPKIDMFYQEAEVTC
jgi:hypothetical protein